MAITGIGGASAITLQTIGEMRAQLDELQRELGWAPRESFATGIEKTVAWYLTHREWAGEITAKKYARERLGTV